MINHMTKQWFKISSPIKTKGVIEYSTDFNFFLNNQIRLVKTGTRHTFCSRLEAKTFKEVTAINKKGEISDFELIQKAKEVHVEILSGKHGQGEFVD